MKYVWIGMSLTLLGCTKKLTTPEQQEKFEACRKTAVGAFAKLPLKQMNAAEKDSALLFIADVKSLDLEHLVEKYDIQKQDIDGFIDAICITATLEQSYDKLEQGLEKANLQMDSTMRVALQKLDSLPHK